MRVGVLAAVNWAGIGIASAVTFILFRVAVLNYFYVTGDMRDSSWIAHVTWRNGWHLHGPATFPGPYFIQHFTPILWITNAVSFAVPLGEFDHYAACIAAAHALFAAGFCRAWLMANPRVTLVGTGIAMIGSLAAAFSAFPVYASRLPHPEIAIPALALWFFIALADQSYRAAAVWLALCLLVREDAGLHVFAVLVAWIMVLIAHDGRAAPRVRWLAGFAFVALAYAAAAFLVKLIWFPGSDTLFRVYLGTPVFHHVTGPFVLDRLWLYLTERTFLVLPFLFSIIWAWVIRNPLVPVGYIATLPWLALHFLAVHPTPGVLGYYYGFPFWLSLAWPLVALFAWKTKNDRARATWPMAALLVVSLVGRDHGRLVVYPLQRDYLGETPFAWNDFSRDRGQYQMFAEWFRAHRAKLGDVMLDQAVGGLLIDQVDRAVWSESWDGRLPDAMIYFGHTHEWFTLVLPRLRSGVYQCIYTVPGTRIELATRSPPDPDAPGSALLVRASSALGTRC